MFKLALKPQRKRCTQTQSYLFIFTCLYDCGGNIISNGRSTTM